MLNKNDQELRLYVELMANRYRGLGVPIEDLIQEGYIGLHIAESKFDEKRNVKFLSYAIYWIKQRMLEAVNEQGKTVHIPSGKINLHRKIQEVKEVYMTIFHREPTADEIKMELQLDEEEYINALKTSNTAISIDKNLTEDSDFTLENILEHDDSLVSSIEQQDLAIAIQEALKDLTEREYFIVTKFFGIGCDKLSLDDIGEELNLTRERCRQIKNGAYDKLKHKIKLHFFS